VKSRGYGGTVRDGLTTSALLAARMHRYVRTYIPSKQASPGYVLAAPAHTTDAKELNWLGAATVAGKSRPRDFSPAGGCCCCCYGSISMPICCHLLWNGPIPTPNRGLNCRALICTARGKREHATVRDCFCAVDADAYTDFYETKLLSQKL